MAFVIFTSTRNRNLNLKFSQAVNQCIPDDGGVFVPSPDDMQNLSNWIYYINNTTSFKSIAGTLTSAFMRDEFSPSICEKIVTSAYTFEPVLRQLDDQLFHLELFHGYTGNHRDIGISYLCSFLEVTHNLKGGNSLIFDYTHGELGAQLSRILKGKQHIKAILLYNSDSQLLGLEKEDLIENGGNILPVFIDKPESEIQMEIKKIFAQRDFAQEHNLTVTNSTNVGRLMAQIFYFPYAFSRVKSVAQDDIYYAVDAGNFASLMAGLYAWNFTLPVKGFFLPGTKGLCADAIGNPLMLDSFVNSKDRLSLTSMFPENLERLEAFFGSNIHMMKHFIHPVEVSQYDTEKAAQELFKKYGTFVDERGARSYASVMLGGQTYMDDGGVFVLISQRHPGLSSDFCNHCIGESPNLPDYIKNSLAPSEITPKHISDFSELTGIIESVKF